MEGLFLVASWRRGRGDASSLDSLVECPGLGGGVCRRVAVVGLTVRPTLLRRVRSCGCPWALAALRLRLAWRSELVLRRGWRPLRSLRLADGGGMAALLCCAATPRLKCASMPRPVRLYSDSS